MPLTSVIIPTCNRAQLVGEAVQSVLDQTTNDYEIIVVDDGSTDGTADMLGRFGSRIRYLSLPHSGLPAVARNQGIRVANGASIAFLDSDDLWAKNALAHLLGPLHQDLKVGLVYSDVQWFDHTTRRDLHRHHDLLHPVSGWIGQRLLQGDCISTSAILIRREVLDDVGLFCEDLSLRGWEDWELWLRIAARHQCALVPHALARVRLHSGKLTSGQDPRTACLTAIDVIERALAFAPDVYGPVYQRALSLQFHRTILALASEGRRQEAQSLLAEAVRYNAGAVREFLTRLRETSSRT